MKRHGRLAVLVVVFTVGIASLAAMAQEPVGPHPWTDKPILDSGDRFQFAIIADITGGRREGVFEQVIEKLNMLQPAFVMSVGDLVEGYSEDKSAVRAERDALRAELDTLDMRFYMVVGNHDLSNPAMVEQWAEQNGPSWYYFVYRDVLFLCLNTEDPPDTHIGEQQIEWARGILAENADVRWTLVFLHKPLWLYGEDGLDRGWGPIAEALKGRPHTVFGGHFHHYIHASRDGAEHYVLATSGGASGMRGQDLGELDHITWVTMRDGGPAIANLEISGIVRRDVVTEEINEMNGFLLSGAYAQTSGVASEAQLFAAGKADLVLTNDRDLPLSIAGRFGAHEQLVAEPADFAVHLDPGESSHLSVAVRAAEATDLLELRPMVLDLAATWQPEGREAITVPSSRRLDVHGTHEGPELVENGRFEDAAQPWFTWVQAPDIGTVAFGDGEMRIGLKDPEFPWSAGMGQYVGALQPNGRYRLSFRASNSGGDGIVQCQVGIDGQTEPLWITVDGERTQGAPVQVGTEPELHTVEFVLPGDVDLSTGKLLFTLGGLREARIDDVSLREITGEPVTVE